MNIYILIAVSMLHDRIHQEYNGAFRTQLQCQTAADAMRNIDTRVMWMCQRSAVQ